MKMKTHTQILVLKSAGDTKIASYQNCFYNCIWHICDSHSEQCDCKNSYIYTHSNYPNFIIYIEWSRSIGALEFLFYLGCATRDLIAINMVDNK